MPGKVFVRGVSEEIWSLARARAVMKRMKMAQVIEESLKLWLGVQEASDASTINWEALTGLGGSGLKDVSERHDIYLSQRRVRKK